MPLNYDVEYPKLQRKLAEAREQMRKADAVIEACSGVDWDNLSAVEIHIIETALTGYDVEYPKLQRKLAEAREHIARLEAWIRRAPDPVHHRDYADFCKAHDSWKAKAKYRNTKQGIF